MNCEEFERNLQQQVDGGSSAANETDVRQHVQNCPACRDLEEGFRLLTQAFTATRPPQPPQGFSERVLDAFEKDRAVHPRWRLPALGLAAAASLLLALGWWLKPNSTDDDANPMIGRISQDDNHSPLTTHDSPASGRLFPELADDAEDTRDGVVLVEAVEPVSQLFLAVGRSLGSPVRPIAISATEALENLIRDIPDPDSMMMPVPGMREMMPAPMRKKMDEKAPSS